MGLMSLVGGAISGIGNIVAGSKQLKAQRETNQTNREINRENNAFNAQQAQQANEWNIQQWERETAYNDPLKQRQRLENAGYNPYMQNVSTGEASSASAMIGASASSPIAMQAPNYGFIGDSINNAFGTFAQLRQQENANKLADSDVSLKNAQATANLASAYINNVNADIRKEQQPWLLEQLKKGNKLIDEQVVQTKVNAKKQEAETKILEIQEQLANLEKDKQHILLKYLPKEKVLELGLKAQELTNAVLDGRLKDVEYNRKLAEICNINADTALKGTQNKMLSKQFVQYQLEFASIVASNTANNWLAVDLANYDSKGVQTADYGSNLTWEDVKSNPWDFIPYAVGKFSKSFRGASHTLTGRSAPVKGLLNFGR